METLDLSKKVLTQLPPLPLGTTVLFCDRNKLIEINYLPTSLRRLDCENNLITQLCELPHSLEFLVCYNNPMTQLPQLPSSLKRIWISPWQMFSCLNKLSKSDNVKNKVIIFN
jgi:E3 ubiquitin-protein ligase SspH2